MANNRHIDGQGEDPAATLVRAAFNLGRHYQADAEVLQQRYAAELRDLIADAQGEWQAGVRGESIRADHSLKYAAPMMVTAPVSAIMRFADLPFDARHVDGVTERPGAGIAGEAFGGGISSGASLP